jgi:hypothetical protein
MISSASTANRGDGRLWVIALGLSLLVNTAILGLVGFATLQAEILRRNQPRAPAAATSVTTVTIFPEMIAAAASSNVNRPAAALPPSKPDYARTSQDQTSAAPPKTKAFIGERNTQATSDRPPDATAPPMPSQSGITKDHPDFETTESDYQDGSLTGGEPTPPQEAAPSPPSRPIPNSDPALAENPVFNEKKESPSKDHSKSSPPPREQLLNGPHPVDIEIPKEIAEKSETKPTPPTPLKKATPAPPATDSPKAATAQTSSEPAFRGHQRKAAIVGSISRTGRSALDVIDSPLGRYQAVISRAVELEWQRNCVRHRDFITPGFLTVRFYVESSGRVRTVQFVGEMETGEVQKGFTLNAIRDAKIPAMPPAVKKDFSKEPLELIFNFYF